MVSLESPCHGVYLGSLSLLSVPLALENAHPGPQWATGVSSKCFPEFSVQSRANQ